MFFCGWEQLKAKAVCLKHIPCIRMPFRGRRCCTCWLDPSTFSRGTRLQGRTMFTGPNYMFTKSKHSHEVQPCFRRTKAQRKISTGSKHVFGYLQPHFHGTQPRFHSNQPANTFSQDLDTFSRTGTATSWNPAMLS